MSKFYKSSNIETSSELFNKRIVYSARLLRSRAGSLVDFSFAEKAFYGKTNRNFVPIVASQQLLPFKNFRSVGNPQQTEQAISFVVDAFEAMAQQFKKAQQLGKIASNDPNLTNLKVYKSYVNNNITYQAYKQQFISAVKQNLDISNINNFDSFVKELLSTISNITKRYPMSMPAYVKSGFNSLTYSGLGVEIAEADYNNDEQKISNFVNSKNWNFYVNTCNSYGFMIDVNTPWRLIADLDSVAMLGYSSRYGINSLQSTIDLGFITTHNSYFNSLTSELLQLYNEVVPRSIILNDECGAKVIQTEQYTLQTLQQKYNNEYFLNFYFNLRFLEEENTFNLSERDKIIKDCLQIARAVNNKTALQNFELYINQPFDYRGSLSYINKAQRVQRADDISNT